MGLRRAQRNFWNQLQRRSKLLVLPENGYHKIRLGDKMGVVIQPVTLVLFKFEP